MPGVPPTSSACRSSSSVDPTSSATPAASRSSRPPRSSPWTPTPANSVRRMKDSSLVRAAEAVRDGRASAMVSAGNTGATMASALLRMGRIKGVQRPAIATPIPVPGSTPTVLLDAGANAECNAEWLVQFAQMGARLRPRAVRDRRAPGRPAVDRRGAHQGQPAREGDPRAARRAAVRSGGRRAAFVGNVEGRDLMTDAADVVVTDGFTGNVALKTLEGGLKAIVAGLLAAFDSSDEARGGLRRAVAGAAAALREPRPREHRRGDAARRRRRLHHQPRLVVGPRRARTPSAWPTTWSPATSSGCCAGPSAPD